MTEPHNSKSDDETRTFDMYHFFSRKDMVLAAIVIVFLILAGLYFALTKWSVI